MGLQTSSRLTAGLLAIAALFFLGVSAVSAAPTAEVAKRCLHYAYMVHPFKRPGAVRMSPDRGDLLQRLHIKERGGAGPIRADQE